MRRLLILVAIVGALLLSAGVATAHSGGDEESVQVEPSAIDAGQVVTFAGSGLEPDSDRVLVLAGNDLVVEFGTVRTDAEGMFVKELDIPSHVPTGSYELRAIGDETLTATLTVTGVAVTGGESGAGSQAAETVVPRDRPAVEIGAMLALATLIVLAGLLVAWRAERVGRALQVGPGQTR